MRQLWQPASRFCIASAISERKNAAEPFVTALAGAVRDWLVEEQSPNKNTTGEHVAVPRPFFGLPGVSRLAISHGNTGPGWARGLPGGIINAYLEWY